MNKRERARSPGRGRRNRRSPEAAPRGDSVERRPSETHRAPAAAGDLPAEYSRTRLVVMEVDPFTVHAYWEVQPHARVDALESLGSEGRSATWILRFYDVTPQASTRLGSEKYFDAPIALESGHCYVHLPEEGKTYVAEIGPAARNGRLAPLCQSNRIGTSRSRPAASYGRQWMRVDPWSGVSEPALAPPCPQFQDEAAEEATPAIHPHISSLDSGRRES